MSYSKYDEQIAKSIQDALNCTGVTENAVFPQEKGTNYRPRSLVDDTLEYIDPTPNIYTLFVQFNDKFFWSKLLPVQVKWSPRMTSCAGICSFHPRNRECIISLSLPLLKLRPRKDLVETLLHEMIHAYLFLTNDNRDRDGHGPIFQSHMKRINSQAGTNITIYHTFHDEVKLYQQHWWRCNGPCQRKPPYFGMVRRAMNRAPGKYDNWWAEHQATCGGQFIKIKEPEKPVNSKKQNQPKGRSSTVTKVPDKNNLLNWVQKNGNTSTTSTSINNKPSQSQVTNLNKIKNDSVSNFQTDLTKLTNNTKSNDIKQGGPVGKFNNSSINTNYQIPISSTKLFNNTKSSVPNVSNDLMKLGNSTNNVHGWGTGGPSSSNSNCDSKTRKTNPTNSSKTANPRISFSGALGGSGSGRSNLLDKFSSTLSKSSSKTSSFIQPTLKGIMSMNKTSSNSSNNKCSSNVIKIVKCPNCDISIDEAKINEHLDSCLESNDKPEEITAAQNKKRKNNDLQTSVHKIFKKDDKSKSNEIECPLCNKKFEPDIFNDHLEMCLDDVPKSDSKDDDVMLVQDSSFSSVDLQDSPNLCLICNKSLKPTESLNDHLEDCVSSVFNDSDSDDFSDSEPKTDKKETLNKYPCPICMTLIDTSSMNVHLDCCLAKTDENEKMQESL